MATKDHKPFIPANQKVPELTFFPIFIGCLLGIIFGASSVYLVLRVGMTVSASIPVAVLSITIFRAFSKITGFRPATILENNITQTTGSAGESLAFGIGVTMPALLIMGYDMELSRIMLVAAVGGLLGILMMIPLRRALIVANHGELAYPEGTACAEVLIAGERGGTSASTVFSGFFLGLFYKFANNGMKLWKDTTEYAFSFFKGGTVAMEVAPELLGVGYIIGPRIASITVAGGILSWLVLIPAIKLFGDGLTTVLFPGTKLISQMSVHEIWRSYVLYIGAGAVAAGGIISLFQSLPTIVHGAMAGLKGIKKVGDKAAGKVLRTDVDLPLSVVGLGLVALILALWFAPQLHLNFLGAILIVVFGFLFVTVSSRLTGEIGSSSNPISGMTVATLLLTCLVFVMMGWIGPEYRITALSIAAVVCVAASNGGTTSQDLKTGFLVGSTPKYQQIAILLGSFSSALVIGYVLKALNDSATIYSKQAVPAGVVITNVDELTQREKAPGDETLYHVLQLPEPVTTGPLAKLPPGKYLVNETGNVVYLVDPGINGTLNKDDNGRQVTKFDAPKARLMSLIIDGILTQRLPWGLVLLGVFIAVLMEFCGVPALPFAVGVYLPLSTTTPIFAGGLVRWLVNRVTAKKKTSAEDEESGPGVLFSSGLIAGGSIAGILLAIVAGFEWGDGFDFSKSLPHVAESDLIALVIFMAVMSILFVVGKKKAA